MRRTCLSLLLGLMSLPLHAGTIHQVFNETYAQSSALATIDLATPPLVDESYLVTVDEDMTGDWVSQTSTRWARISAGRTTWEPNSWEMATPRLSLFSRRDAACRVSESPGVKPSRYDRSSLPSISIARHQQPGIL